PRALCDDTGRSAGVRPGVPRSAASAVRDLPGLRDFGPGRRRAAFSATSRPSGRASGRQIDPGLACFVLLYRSGVQIARKLIYSLLMRCGNAHVLGSTALPARRRGASFLLALLLRP